ncbi:MAG: hypothetical protein HC836_34685 [Richelia sp. RM2_1_2]|nr:hypothetical protein [Richelia sp. RM2_1_2]
MKTLKEFKDEYRSICVDTWGDALEAWFECTGHMNKRKIKIPAKWEYDPGAGNGTCKESYWHSIFKNMSDEMLVKIGSFLFRYCEYLRFKEVNY